MRIKSRYITALLVAEAAATAIGAAPTSAAAWGGNYGPFFGYDRGHR
jgi:hypothetical protein